LETSQGGAFWIGMEEEREGFQWSGGWPNKQGKLQETYSEPKELAGSGVPRWRSERAARRKSSRDECSTGEGSKGGAVNPAEVVILNEVNREAIRRQGIRTSTAQLGGRGARKMALPNLSFFD